MTPAERVAAAKTAQAGKALVAPGGWVFLVNDTNDFLSWQFGASRWTPDEQAVVESNMAERLNRLAPAAYLMVVTPEKSVPYQALLPHGLAAVPPAPDRPAPWLARRFPQACLYPADRLTALQTHGLLYFRGDTHVNGLGAFHLYRETILKLRAQGAQIPPPLEFGMLKPAAIGFEGDVYVQIDPEQKAVFDADPDSGRWNDMLEIALAFSIRPGRARAHQVEPVGLGDVRARELAVYAHEDQSLPRALIFRDSTATHLVDFMAQHFSRSVFVWHDRDVAADLVERERPDIVVHFIAERFLATYPRLSALSR